MNLALLHPCPICLTISGMAYLVYKKYISRYLVVFFF